MCIAHKTKSPTKLVKNSTPYTIVLDWLEVTVKQIKETTYHEYDGEGQLVEVIPLNNNVHLLRQKNKSGHNWKGSKSYSAFYSVFLHGEEVALLQTGSRFGKHDQSQIKLLNHILYRKAWRSNLEAILEATQTELSNFTRIDVAIDGRGFIAQHLAHREGVRSGQLKKVGRAKTSIIEKGQYNCEGFNIGTRKSGKYLTGYEKGNLILNSKKSGRDHKPYIVQFWQDNSLISDPDKIEDIERLEMKLTSQALNKVKDLTLDSLEDTAFLAGLFELQCENFYQWVEAGADTNTTRAKAKAIVHAVRWELFKVKQVVRDKVKKCKNALWGARMTISQLMREYYINTKYAFWESCTQAEAQMQYCKIMAERYGISDWFNHKLTSWKNDREHQQEILAAVRAAQFRPV